MDFPIELHIAELRPAQLSLSRLSEELVQNMTGIVNEVLMDAQTDPDASQASGPTPVFDGGTWHSWKTGDHRYTPITTRVNNVSLASDTESDKRHMFQNKAGVVATTDDAYGIRPTVILQEGLVSVDWDVGSDFLCILSGNRVSSFYMAHSKPGMEIGILLANNGTNQVAGTWDPLIKWPAATAPVVPAALPGTSTRQKITLRNINGTIYGDYLNYTNLDPISYDASQPLFLS